MQKPKRIKGTENQDQISERKESSFVARSIGVLAIAVTLLLLFSHLEDFFSSDDYLRRSEIKVSRVERGAFEHAVKIEGVVASSKNPSLYAQTPGMISLMVQQGQRVAEGELLAKVVSPGLANDLEQNKALLDLQRAQLDALKADILANNLLDKQTIAVLEIRVNAARRELSRMSRVSNRSSLSQNDFEKLQDEVAVLQLQHSNAQKQLDLNETKAKHLLRTRNLQIEQKQLIVADLNRKILAQQIVSPIDGFVGEVHVMDQDQVLENQILLSVVDPEAFNVDIAVPESYSEHLALNQSVIVSYRAEEFPALVKSISPEVVDGVIQARVDFVSAYPSGLRNNVRVNARLIFERRENVLLVSRGPFVEAHGKRGVYVMEHDKAYFTEIEIGSLGVRSVELLRGLDEGDLLIISDTSKLAGAETVSIFD